MQRLLIAKGYELGEPDGMVGSRTRQALQAAQRELGLPTDGRAGQKALQALRASASAPASATPR
ncbi:putative peptidoglycan binding domain protein [compost metagenome]